MAGSTRKKAEEISPVSQKLRFTYATQNAGDLIFEFFDENVDGLSSWNSSIHDSDGSESFGSHETEDESEEEDQGNGSKAEADKAFWVSQQDLLVVRFGC